MPGISTAQFGRIVLARRTEKDWTQEELAHHAFGNSERKGYVSQIESGALRTISARTVQKLARVLGIEPDIVDRLIGVGAPTKDETQAELERLIHENGSLKEALDNLTHLTHDGLIALATRFGIADAHRLTESTLRANLADKAEDYARLRAQIERIDDRVASLGNLKAAARDAAERLDFAEVEALLSRVDEVETEIAAETKELRAENFLLQGRAQQAYDVLTAAADSFASIDRLEPAQRRMTYGGRLYRHGLRYGGDGLRLSARMLTAALTIVAGTDDPQLWAATQNNLGIALQMQGSRTAGEAGAALLAEAVAAYRVALEVFSQADHPLDWAMTQNNLGNALWAQGSRTDGEASATLLAEAVAAYRAALEVRTKADCPLDWATTQNNLGNALGEQGSRTAGDAGAALLTEAVDAYRAALEVRTKADHPLAWAMTEENLAILEEARAQHDNCTDPAPHLDAALAHVTAALAVYDPEHLNHYYEKAIRLRDEITAALQALGR